VQKLACVLALIAVAVVSRAASAQEAEVEGDWPEGKWQIDFDAIGATVHVPVTLPTTSGPTTADAKLATQSLSLGASYGITDAFRVGVQLPWTHSTIEVAGLSRSATSIGNAELDGWFEHAWSETISATYGLGIAGGGQGKSTSTAQDDRDRAAANRAASNARGYSFDARYESGRSSAIPSIEVDFFRRGVQVEPYFRLQLLHDVTGEQPNPNVVTTELGARVAYRFWNTLDTGVRAFWFAIPGGNVDHVGSSVVVEPELRARFGPVTPLLGVLVPVAGPFTNPRIVAGELAVNVDI